MLVKGKRGNISMAMKRPIARVIREDPFPGISIFLSEIPIPTNSELIAD